MDKAQELIAVYGSLRKGYGNHAILKDAELVSTEVVNIPFKMVSLGGFPGLVPDESNHNITIEIYRVNETEYRRVERLEGYPHFYQKALINTSQGELEVYVLNDPMYKNDNHVESGDWIEYNPPRVHSYY